MSIANAISVNTAAKKDTNDEMMVKVTFFVRARQSAIRVTAVAGQKVMVEDFLSALHNRD